MMIRMTWAVDELQLNANERVQGPLQDSQIDVAKQRQQGSKQGKQPCQALRAGQTGQMSM